MTMGLCLEIRVIIHDAKPLTYQSALQHYGNGLPYDPQGREQ
jgi:hypothetical protein